MGSPPYLCHFPGWCIFCVWACSRRDSLSCVPVFLHSSKLCQIILVEVGASLVIPRTVLYLVNRIELYEKERRLKSFGLV